MGDVIDINSKLNGPDADCVWTDMNGIKWYKFDCSYDFEKPYSFTIWATSMENAKERLSAIQSNGRVDGQVLSEVPE